MRFAFLLIALVLLGCRASKQTVETEPGRREVCAIHKVPKTLEIVQHSLIKDKFTEDIWFCEICRSEKTREAAQHRQR